MSWQATKLDSYLIGLSLMTLKPKILELENQIASGHKYLQNQVSAGRKVDFLEVRQKGLENQEKELKKLKDLYSESEKELQQHQAKSESLKKKYNELNKSR